MTMRRLHLATMALETVATLPPLADANEAAAQLAALVALLQEQAAAGDGFNVHLMALRAAALALRIAEMAEG